MKNKYQQIFEEAIEPRLIVEIKSLKILDLNKTAKKLFGTKKNNSKKMICKISLLMNRRKPALANSIR